MKRLTLFRHAKSGWDEPVTRDFDRPLNAKGKRAAAVMGRHMREQGLRFDRIVASPAVRVVETLDAMFEGYGKRLAPVWDRRIYLASAATLLEVVQDTPEEVESLLLVGHNPGLEDLVLALVPDAADDVARIAVGEKYPTASLAEVDFCQGQWSDVGRQDAKLARFVRPRDLDPALGPDTVV
ncbi:MAG: histidine phosphatase family protein [Sphingomonadaceae bacterium]|nr:histidine phosphatase family protein [Sphingomonadaceae bacterium]